MLADNEKSCFRMFMHDLDTSKLSILLTRALRDGSTEGDGAIRVARQMVERSPDFRPEDRIVVIPRDEAGRWQQAHRLLKLSDDRLAASRRYRETLLGELQAILAPTLLEKLKRKAVKAAGDDAC